MTNESLNPDMGETRETDPAGQPAGSVPAGDTEMEGQVMNGHDADGQLTDDDGQLTDNSAAADIADGFSELDTKVAELTNDLQRKHAEFVNFRKRTLRDIEDAKAKAKGSVLGSMLDVMDDIDRAREHGDLKEGPLRAFSDKLVNTLSGQGLTAFGEVGDVFNPELHEAVQHSGDGGVPIIVAVLRRGYRADDRVLRTAMVVVEDRLAEQGYQAPVGEPSDQSAG